MQPEPGREPMQFISVVGHQVTPAAACPMPDCSVHVDGHGQSPGYLAQVFAESSIARSTSRPVIEKSP